MSPEEQQIAIAEALGYTQEEPWLDGRDCWSHKDHPPHVGFDVIPDYLHDLNAIHEAVKTIPQNLMFRYFACLCNVVSGSISLYGYSKATEATAAQRCEAFLKTLDKWTNDN